ncbi:MAG: hypothetical protein ACHQIO_09945 [Nevskiales bacterium]
MPAEAHADPRSSPDRRYCAGCGRQFIICHVPETAQRMSVLKILGCLLLLGIGFAGGAVSFVNTQARPLPEIHNCAPTDECLTDPEVLGLLTSVGLHLAPGLMPDIVARSGECIAIRSPRPEAYADFVFFPLRDIRNLLDMAPGDEKYIQGCIALMRQLVDRRGMRNWKIVSNGPGKQEIAYLHFHLLQEAP